MRTFIRTALVVLTLGVLWMRAQHMDNAATIEALTYGDNAVCGVSPH